MMVEHASGAPHELIYVLQECIVKRYSYLYKYVYLIIINQGCSLKTVSGIDFNESRLV